MKRLSMIFGVLALFFLVAPLFAQGDQDRDRDRNQAPPINWGVPIGAGIGMAIASGLCGIGQGKATASATEALARNPGARGGIQIALILGLALIESLALYTLVIIIIKVK